MVGLLHSASTSATTESRVIWTRHTAHGQGMQHVLGETKPHQSNDKHHNWLRSLRCSHLTPPAAHDTEDDGCRIMRTQQCDTKHRTTSDNHTYPRPTSHNFFTHCFAGARHHLRFVKFQHPPSACATGIASNQCNGIKRTEPPVARHV